MNCTRVQELLPLYVGADLAAREAENVRAHLEICTPCQELAGEFAASTAWLQAAPPPEFDEAFFAALRGDVQQAIAQTELRPSWAERWLPVGNWRWAWVPVLALILLAIALNWQRQRVLPVAPPGIMVEKKPGQPSAPTVPGQAVPAPNQFAVSVGPSRKQRRSTITRRNAVETRDVAVEINSPVQASPELAVPAESALAVTKEITRIEIQTADPNIRIIWLTPKPPGAAANQAEPLTH